MRSEDREKVVGLLQSIRACAARRSVARFAEEALALLSEDAPPGPNRTLNEAAAALAGTVRWALRSHPAGLVAVLGSQETEALKDELVALEVALRSEDAPEPAEGDLRLALSEALDERDALKAELEEARSCHKCKRRFGDAPDETLPGVLCLSCEQRPPAAQLSEPSGGRGDRPLIGPDPGHLEAMLLAASVRENAAGLSPVIVAALAADALTVIEHLKAELEQAHAQPPPLPGGDLEEDYKRTHSKLTRAHGGLRVAITTHDLALLETLWSRCAAPPEGGSEEINCESCGATDLVPQASDALCHGCGKTLCQSCVDVFGHWSGGSHGTGDPSHPAKEPPDVPCARCGRYDAPESEAPAPSESEPPCGTCVGGGEPGDLERLRDELKWLLDEEHMERFSRAYHFLTGWLEGAAESAPSLPRPLVSPADRDRLHLVALRIAHGFPTNSVGLKAASDDAEWLRSLAARLAPEDQDAS